jgi:hypothetical protein
MRESWTLAQARDCIVRQVVDVYVADPFEPIAAHLMLDPAALPPSSGLLEALLAADQAAGVTTERIIIRTKPTLNGKRSATLVDRGLVTDRARLVPGYGPPARPDENEIPNAPPVFEVPPVPWPISERGGNLRRRRVI